MRHSIFFGLFFSSLLLIANIELHSQSLTIVDPVTEVSGDLDDEIKAEYRVKNVTSADLLVKESIHMINLTQGHEIVICWGKHCNLPISEDVTVEDIVNIHAGEHTDPNKNHAILEPNGVYGTSTVEFKFFVEGNPYDYCSLIVTFHVVETSVIVEHVEYISSIAPIPAQDFVNFKFNLISDGVLNIYNSFGQKNRQVKIQSTDQIRLDASSLSDGMYFYSLTSRGEQKQNGKFIIAR